MTADADWIDDLERKAKAATPGPWYAWDRGVGWLIALDPDGDVRLPEGMRTDLGRREDAEFIAAANPTTILRLIEAARRAEDYNAEAERHAARVVALEAQNEDLTAERDKLAAKVAAVEALADETEQAGDPLLRLDRLRAALSAAPTDTTKEQA